MSDAGSKSPAGPEVVTGLDHVGIAVDSIADASALYRRMGLEITSIEEVPHEGVRVAIIPCGGVRIELLEATGPDSPIARFLARRGPGIHHLCFATGDVRGADRELRQGGFELLRPAPVRGAEGCWVQFVHPRSAGGVLLELSQRPAAEHDP